MAPRSARRRINARLSAARILFLALIPGGFPAAGCFSPPRRAPDADVVPCPLSSQANSVLRNVIEACASDRGHWARDLGPGCPRIWAVQLGCAAGIRRQREDLIQLARVTAGRQNSDVNSLILSALFGAVDRDSPAGFGLPALLISGMRDGNGSHFRKFRLVIERALEEMNLNSLGDNQRAGLSAVLAAYAGVLGESGAETMRRAREIAVGVERPRFRAFALAAVARVTGEPSDVEAARAAVEEGTPAFRITDGKLAFEPEEEYILSEYLALIHALADMAQLGDDPLDRTRAQALLDFTFSERLFDGRLLMHDGGKRGRSREFCSGCNLNALYLVDRLYGDTWKIDPLPPLPRRPDPWRERREEAYALFVLRDRQDGTFGGESFGVTVGYAELPRDERHPHGALRVRFRLADSIQGCRFERAGENGVVVPLDADNRARYPLGRDAVVSGEYDPEVSGYAFEFGPARDGGRLVRLLTYHLADL